jgi:hypothetical protein
VTACSNEIYIRRMYPAISTSWMAVAPLREVPFLDAPNLFGIFLDPKGSQHCYVKRQPVSPAELDEMVNVIRCAEFQCIRYRGAEHLIQLRLVEADEGMVCDILPSDLRSEAERRNAESERRWQVRLQSQQSPVVRGSRATPRRWWQFWWASRDT